MPALPRAARHTREDAPVKTVLTWLAIIIAVLWVVKDPTGAAAFARNVAHFLGQAADSLGTLASSL